MLLSRDPDFVAKLVPAVLLGLQITACSSFAGNHVVAWGSDNYGQTNVPPSATNVIAIAAGYSHSLALRSDGTVIAWGTTPATNVPAGLSNVVAIAAGHGQNLVLRNDGTLVAWGAPSTAATATIPSGISNIVAIACGDDHNLVLKSDGTIYAWGANYSNQTNVPPNLSNVVAIVAGNVGSLAIKNDGTAWGSGTFTNIISAFSNVVVAGALVADGDYQGAVVLGDGCAHAWGYPTITNVTVVSNVTRVVGRSGFNQAGSVWMLCRDGTLAGLGQYLGQSNVWMNLSNVLEIAIGYTHHLAIVGDSSARPIEPILNASFNDSRFTVSQPTSLGRSYRLEYENSLGDNWQILPPVPGNGGIQVLADVSPPASQRFYRVYAGP